MERHLKKIEDFYHHYPRSNDWAVNFTNVKELPVEQVKQYFSKWGVIKNVRQTGTSGSGYCFVHFEREESARNCATDMKSDFSVRLRPFLDPLHFSTRKEGEDAGVDGDELDFSFKKRAYKKELKIDNGKQKNSDDKSKDAGIPDRKLNGISRSSGVSARLQKVREGSPMNVLSHDSSSSPQKILKYSGSVAISKEKSRGREIPPLRAASKALGLASTGALVKTVTAEEVIVANIPESWEIHFILYLFQEFKPICVTDIELIQHNSIRYCHMYFQTPFAAEIVEIACDNQEINGQRLIVLRVARLMEEAARA